MQSRIHQKRRGFSVALCAHSILTPQSRTRPPSVKRNSPRLGTGAPLLTVGLDRMLALGRDGMAPKATERREIYIRKDAISHCPGELQRIDREV